MVGHTVYAQEQKVTGFVIDTQGKPLKSVNVLLTSVSDTLKKVTDKHGYFAIDNIKSRNFFLHYSLMGCKTAVQYIENIDNKSLIVVPNVQLENFSIDIQDVNVVKIVPVIVNGDTVQFNFGAFDFRKNSLLEDGLKKLPGFQVGRDGSVYYNGQVIRRVKVDNKVFFGGDLLTATKNIPVEIIKNIQVIEFTTTKEGETGISTSLDSEKILNISLKDDKKKIFFGQVTAGAGTNDRYLGSFGANRFDDGEEVSILGSFNNTNTNLFSYGNLTGGEREKHTFDLGEYTDPIDGINTVSSIAFNVSDKIRANTSFRASYSFVQQDNITEGTSRLKSTYIGNTITRDENYQLKNSDQNHKFKFGLESKFNNGDLFTANGNFNFLKQDILSFKETVLTNFETRNKGQYQDSSRTKTPSADLEFLYSKFFSKKGRKLIGTLSLNNNQTQRKEFVEEEYVISDRNYQSSNLFKQNQFIRQYNYSDGMKASIAFVEPFLKHSLFEFTYDFDITRIDADRTVEDASNLLLIDSLLLDYNYYFRANKTGVVYQYEPNKKMKFNIGFAVQPLTMRGTTFRDIDAYKYENINLIPTANLTYKISKTLDLQFSYKGKNNQPFFNQIAPVVDNSSSRNIIVGNPELKAEFSHRLYGAIRKNIPSKMQFFETNFSYNIITDKIVSDKKSLENSIVQQTTFKNTMGYYDWKWNYLFNTTLFNEDWQLDLNGSTDYYNNLSYIDERKRTTKQLILNQTMQLKYNWSDYFETMFNSNYAWSSASYDIPNRTKINVETLFLGLGGRGYVSDNFSLGFEMSQRFNEGYNSSFMNVNQTAMNAFLEYTFFPNRTALLRLQGYDLFDQNKNMGIYSEYIGNDVFEARNNRLGRYFMLSLNIRLQKLPKGK